MSALQIIDHEGSAQLLQTPIPINPVKQICSVLTELRSDIKHLLSSYHQATLSLCEHHKASGNTDNMLQSVRTTYSLLAMASNVMALLQIDTFSCIPNEKL